MRVHEFTLILTADPNEEESNRLYSIFNDGTLVTMAGVPQIHFHREAPSLEEAIGSALAQVRKAGFDAVRVEIEPLNIFTALPQNRARSRSGRHQPDSGRGRRLNRNGKTPRNR